MNRFAILFRALDRRRRGQLGGLIFLMLIGAAAEIFAISAIFPFLTVVVGEAGQSVGAPGGLAGRVSDLLDLIPIEDKIVAAAILLMVMSALAGAVRLLLNWSILSFVLMFSHDIGREIFRRLLRQPYENYLSRNSSEYLSAIEKIQVVVWGVLMPGMYAVVSTFMAAIIGAFLLLLDPSIALASFALFALGYLIFTLLVVGALKRNSDLLAASAAGRVQVIQEGLGGIRDIILDQSQAAFQEKFDRLDYGYRRAQMVNNFIAIAPRFLFEALGVILVAAIVLYFNRSGAGFVESIPLLGAFAIGAMRLLPLIQQAFNGWSSYRGNQSMLRDITDLLQMTVTSTVRREKLSTPLPLTEEMKLDGVEFRYPDGTQVLEGVELAIRKGSMIGVVGPTGGGKSTLLDIFMALLAPTTGRFTVDGKPIDDSNRAAWQAQIAHVPQTIFLADATIAENIAFGEPPAQIDRARVEQAGRLALVEEFVTALPQGYETMVGERGVRLSGGQRQRIGLARALYRGGSVLILDEATSALDSATELAVMRSLHGLRGEKTIIMIAHRVTTLADCDGIVEVNGGAVRWQ